MSAFIAGLVTFFKGVDSLRQIGEFFVTEWIKFDVDRIGDETEARKEEVLALENAMKRTTNDSERLALLRSLDRTRELSDRS